MPSIYSGLKIKLIDNVYTGCIQGFATKESGITSYKDLAGKNIGMFTEGDMAQLFIQSLMKQDGIDYSNTTWKAYSDGGVTAPSGKGKSTLLSVCGLLMKPTSGNVFINDVDASSLDYKALSTLRGNTIGFMFQHTQLAGNFRAHENISMPSSFCHSKEKPLNKSAILRRENELLDCFGLSNRKFYYPGQLSIGQKRRIACARALFMQPDLIIADEPTNDLDEENKKL